MQLFYSPNSPYARKCRIVIIEKNLQNKVELKAVEPPPAITPALLAANPLARIPALIMDNGKSLCESPVICEYLDSLSPLNSLFPTNPNARFEALRIAALGSGIMDSAVSCVLEGRRPEEKRYAPWIERKENAVRDTIKLVAKENFDESTIFDIGTINVAVALSYVDFRMPHIEWSSEHKKLAKWLEFISKRASMLATAPVP